MREPPPRPRRLLAAISILFALVSGVAGCGGDVHRSTETKVINITFDGSEVTPNGDRVQVSVDQPIELHVTADEAGTMHVHSDPGQDLSYRKGTTVIKLVIDRPGIVTVESHHLNKTIVQLEVR